MLNKGIVQFCTFVQGVKNTLFQLCLIGTIATTSQLCFAKNSPYQDIMKLLELQKYESAYQLSQTELNEWEGDVQFDFALALSARSVGNLEQAVFAFERVISSEPSFIQARYLLAVTYFEIGNLIAAQQQFTLVQAHYEHTVYTDQTTQYLNAITQRINRKSSHWQNWAKLSVGFDSNPNNGIKDDFVLVPLLGNVRLFEQSQQTESLFTDAQIQFLYISPQNQQSAWYAGVDAQNISFDETNAWSRTFLGATAGYKSRWQRIEWDLNGFYRNLSLDSNAYLDYSGLSANFSYSISDLTYAGMMLLYAKENYDQLSELDKNQSVASIWLSNQINQTMKHKIDFRFGSERASDKDAKHIERDIWGIGYQYNWQFSNQWGLSGKLDYLKTKHQSAQPLFGIVQQDKLLRAALEFEYRFSSPWRASLTANHIRNSSNIVLYDYDRNKVQLSLKYAF